MTVTTASSIEHQLLLKVAEGNQLAFNELFDRYHPTVHSTALKLTGDALLAEEIVQDTFLKVWLKKDELPNIGNFKGWLYTIARNFTYNALREAKTERERMLNFIEEAMIQEAPSADTALKEKEFAAILSEAVALLPEKQRETYRLIKEQDLKRHEVAEVLQVSPETVKWNLEQAVKKVRTYCMVRLHNLPKIWLLYFLAKYL